MRHAPSSLPADETGRGTDRLLLLEQVIGRINPRVIKQKMSQFKKKRPEQRRLPPLQKTFAQSVVMLC